MLGKAVLAMAAMLVSGAGGNPGEEATAIVGAEDEINLCLTPGNVQLMRESDGRRSAVLVLYAVSGQGGPLAVTADTGEETLIGLFPGGPFTAETDADARRYLLPGGQETRCWTVKPTGGGSVELALELSDPLE